MHTLSLEYEQLNIILHDLMDDAELKYRKLYTTTITWHPAYKRVFQMLKY